MINHRVDIAALRLSISEMQPDRINQLSARERDCLRLVSRDLSSKEIAKRLGISHHTVDDHLKRAISGLGVSSRFEAARLLAAAENRAEAPPQSLGTQPLEVVPAGLSSPGKPPDRSMAAAIRQLPFLRQGRRENDLTPGQRLVWIFAGAVAIIILFAQLANGLSVVQSIAHGLTH